jgi:hypothetical protein
VIITSSSQGRFAFASSRSDGDPTRLSEDPPPPSTLTNAATNTNRHTHAALLIAVNTHPKLLQSRLGHSSIKTTLDIYGHLYEPLDEAAADRLEELVLGAIAHETRIWPLDQRTPPKRNPCIARVSL